MEVREIYHVLKSIVEPIHAHDDQMVEIAKWIEAEFEYRPQKQASGVNTEGKALHIDSVMPRRLTAENGAKGLLIGEFHETIVCHDDEGEPYEVKMPVEWDTIKQIYAKIVERYGA